MALGERCIVRVGHRPRELLVACLKPPFGEWGNTWRTGHEYHCPDGVSDRANLRTRNHSDSGDFSDDVGLEVFTTHHGASHECHDNDGSSGEHVRHH